MSAQGDGKSGASTRSITPVFPTSRITRDCRSTVQWDYEREAQQVGDLLGRLENQSFALTVRECVDDPRLTVPQIDSITAIDETSLPDQHDTRMKYYEEPLRWQSRVQHD
jgi:hypothetical protein